MKHFYLICIFFFLMLSCSSREKNVQSYLDDRQFALVGINIVDVEKQEIIYDQTVLVSDGIIFKIGTRSQISIPSETTIIDAKGLFVIPGLWDMHVHLADKASLKVYLAHGIVGIRDMAANMYVPSDSVQNWKQNISNKNLIGPEIVCASPLLDGAPSGYEGTIVISDPSDVPVVIEQIQGQEADFIKILGSLSKEVLLALSDEAHNRNLSIVGHLPTDVRAIDAAPIMKSMEHLMGIIIACSVEEDSIRIAYQTLHKEENPNKRSIELKRRMFSTYDKSKANQLFEQLKIHESFQVPTLKGWDFDMRGLSGAVIEEEAWGLVPKTKREEWKQALEWRASLSNEQLQLSEEEFNLYLKITNDMNKSGVSILAGTDTPHTLAVPGLALHQELQLLVESGFSPAEAIASATINASKFLELDHERGHIKPDYVADLLIIRDNPLEDIKNTLTIEYVVKNGIIYDIRSITKLLEQARMSYR